MFSPFAVEMPRHDDAALACLRDAIDAISHDRTLIVVAHRLATVVDADQILVLEDGRLQAVGTHPELLMSSPLYLELAEHQLVA